MHVLIVGCGYVGTALGVRLAAEGHVVWGLRRTPGGLPATIKPVEADLMVPNTLRHLPKVDVAFYLTHVEGLRYLLGALAATRQRVRRLFCASALEVYGDRKGAWVDEESALAPTSDVGRRLVEAEGLANDAPFDATIVRLGEVYGPGRPGILEHVLSGRPVPVGRPTEHVSLLHRDDAAGALAHLASLRKPAPSYVVVDREPVPRIEVVHWLATRTGRPPPPLEPSAGRPPAADVRAMSERLVESGYHFRYPTFREGYGSWLDRA